MRLPEHINLLARVVAAKFPALLKGDDDQRRQWTTMLAEQAAFSYPGEGWGTKRAGHGRPLSTDAIARLGANGLEAWDLIDGTTRRLINGGIYHLIPDQVFVSVEPKNHLADETPAPAPLPIPAPAPPADDALLFELLRSFERIADGLEGIKGAIVGLNERVGNIEQSGLKLRLR